MNNLETEIEMKEDLENDLIEDEDACDDVKNDSKSSRVYLTQPSDDLNRYMVDKFHPPTAKSNKFLTNPSIYLYTSLQRNA